MIANCDTGESGRRLQQFRESPAKNSQLQIVCKASWQVIYCVMKKFEELTECEILALAIAMEEEDERVYADYAYDLKQDFPSTAAIFDGMREEESSHWWRLIDLYREKFSGIISP